MFPVPDFFKTGHRGCRGLYPENTVEGFLHAIALGCNTLEFDVVVSKDHQLVVSHEPYMNPEICLKPDGSFITEDEASKYNLFRMTYQEIKSFDCGLKTNIRFPDQKKTKAIKPLLEEVILACENYVQSTIYQYQPFNLLYDLEIKSEEAEYGFSQPTPDVFAEMIAGFIFKHNLVNKVLIRSFDPAPLRYLHDKYPELPLAFIVENNRPAAENLDYLGFHPLMYSPEYVLLTREEMNYLKSLKMLVVPWTVNTPEEMKEMLRLEVDGIITDYPNLFKTMGL
ncbi:MAG TPA: glycerophosphodiester phosphodiesterase family protein [Cytophagaceae bacterium]|nr:glycerophosphodiester phosphodiesterase family protein [Cytophagaceae bacterium]